MSIGEHVPLLTEHGVKHEWVDNGDGTYSVVSSQDVEPILDRNKAMANHNDGYSPSRQMRRLASIPNIVLMQWLNECGGDMKAVQDPKFLKKKLDDADNQYLRTSHFVLGC